MNKQKKRIRRYFRYFEKTKFVLLNKIFRILSWLLPGLVIKRWMITSAIGFLTSLLGLTILVHSPTSHYFLVPFIALYTIGYLSIGLSSAVEFMYDRKSQYKKSDSAVISNNNMDAKSEAAYVSEI